MKWIVLCLMLQWGALSAKLVYPETPKVDHVDEYNGIVVADPYRWMEEENSEQLRAWVAEQNAFTQSYFDKMPLKKEMLNRLEKLASVENRDLPTIKNGKWFWTQSELFYRKVLYTGDDFFQSARVLIDPSELSSDGSVQLEDYFPSSDGKWVIYCTSEGGSDWHTARVRNVETGEDLPDTVEWIKFPQLLWEPSGEGFFYARFDAPPPNCKLTALNTRYKAYYHKLGTSQEEDVFLCDNREDLNRVICPHTIVDQRYLGFRIFDYRTFSIIGFFYKDLGNSQSALIKWFEDPGFSYGFIGKTEQKLFLSTNKNGARGSVVAVDVDSLPDCQWEIVIPETSAVLISTILVKDQLVCQYLHNGCPEIRVFSLEGEFLYEVKLPKKICAIEEIGSYFEKEIWLKISSPELPPAIYRFDVGTGILETVFKPSDSYSTEDIETHRVFYPAKDGTPLILFISHKKGVALDGKNPTLLYGYGGYGYSFMTIPRFSLLKQVWLEKGGVCCIAAIRGGGEYGREPHWHSAQKTQQHIDDFVNAAEWLIQQGYTSEQHLGIYGASFGGWLMGSCINQRPDLFKAAVIGNGTLDLLRAPYYTIAWFWFAYAQPWEPDLFFSTYSLSPYHNVQKGKNYPAVFEIKGDCDDRVVPFHTYKHVARLQDAQGGDAPILLYTGHNQGHAWAGANTLDPVAMMLAFFYKNLR